LFRFYWRLKSKHKPNWKIQPLTLIGIIIVGITNTFMDAFWALGKTRIAVKLLIIPPSDGIEAVLGKEAKYCSKNFL